jgi:hypothetical protein
MNISQESERMAQTNCQLAWEGVRTEYERKRYILGLVWRNDGTLNKETGKLVLDTLTRMGDTLTDCFLEAFALEGKVLDRDDLQALNRRLENFFAGNYGLQVGTLDPGTLKDQIDDLDHRACARLQALAHKMKLQAAKPQKATYELNINQNYGPLQQGPDNTQDFKTDETKSRS